MSVPPPKSTPRDTSPEFERPELPDGEGRPSWDATVLKDILVGQRVGEYVVRRRIGSGGMGIVYEGEHPIIGRKVAIKLIRPDETGLRTRDLASEARATSAIRHRGIIDIFGFGTLPGIGQYLVMELLSGQPLDEVLQQRAPLPLAEALRLTGELLGALSAAHAEGVIHRDLKPGNIFLVRESQGAEYVKVLDFGLAKQAPTPHGATPQTRASIVLGTPEYMAPEQAYGQAISPRTDLYAVGIILFEMLTGRLPFQGDTPMHLLIKQINEAPPAPSSLVEGLPPELDTLVLRLLAKEPEQRPASAEDTARELGAILRTLQWDSTRISGVTPSVRPSGVRPAVAPPSREGPRSGPHSDVHPDNVGFSPTLLTQPLPQPVSKPASVSTLRMELPPEASPSPRANGRRRLGGGLLLLALVGGGLALGTRLSATNPAPPTPTAPASRPPEPTPPPVATAPAEPAPSSEPVTPPVATAPVEPEPSFEPPSEPPSEPSFEPPSEPSSEPPSEPVVPPSVTPPSVTPVAGSAAGTEVPPARRPGSLQVVASQCWGVLFIDGKLRGRTPQRALSLREGTHRLELRDNPHVANESAEVVIKSGARTEFVARCQRID